MIKENNKRIICSYDLPIWHIIRNMSFMKSLSVILKNDMATNEARKK